MSVLKSKKIKLFIFFILLIGFVCGQEKRDLIQRKTHNVDLSIVVKDRSDIFPTYQNRNFWESISDSIKREVIIRAEKIIDEKPQGIPLTAYLEFVRTGDRSNCDRLDKMQRGKLETFVLAELIEGKGRFIDAIINHSWALCERSTWVGTAHLPKQKRKAGVPDIQDIIIDLYAGETGVLLAWTCYFFEKEMKQVSPLIPERIKYELSQHLFEPYLNRDDFFWMGFGNSSYVNNWNVWCNFNVVLAVLLAEDNIVIKKQVVEKSIRSVDQFINYYKEDGGCDEGPSYWDHAPGKLMEYLELLSIFSSGEINLFDEPLIKRMGRYILNMHIDNRYFVNFADASARSTSIPTVIYRYGKNCNDKELMQFGRYMGEYSGVVKNPLQGSITQKINNLLIYNEFIKTEPKAVHPQSCWMDGIQVAIGRGKKESNKGLFFAAKGGHNGESHNHNDVGNFVVYKDGLPFIIDAGVGTYNSSTFSNKRYEIWNMQSSWHNLPEINGSMQLAGRRYSGTEAFFKDNGKKMIYSLDISKAYPKEAYCKSWIRTFEFDRNKKLVIKENFELDSITDNTIVYYLTCCEVVEDTFGKLQLKNEETTLQLLYDPEILSFSKEELVLQDQRMERSWGKKLTRMAFKIKNPSRKQEIVIQIK